MAARLVPILLKQSVEESRSNDTFRDRTVHNNLRTFQQANCPNFC